MSWLDYQLFGCKFRPMQRITHATCILSRCVDVSKSTWQNNRQLLNMPQGSYSASNKLPDFSSQSDNIP